jgi:nitroimidazol reductase NimA-like FMN-containing flavoprotein (pyridoxamine 5'-phosphate oxidase superfamily)
MLGILNPEQIDHVLYAQVAGRIGCYAAGKVYVVPVTYVYQEGYIYGHTKEGLKIDLMRQNPAVCFQVDAIQNMANWQCIIIQGEFQELSGEESQQAIGLLSNRVTPLLVSETSMPAYSPDMHHPRTNKSGNLVTYRIRIIEKSGRYEKR